ncbi:alpha/beta fold hydrolase [Fertoebacter nigrum]|uniref:Alpha/beta fold hydrolase n=1 Tax=Fertoeibacter niger TaxID=2656921 RepID=A0A8X8GX83_9RHOB|nr:alpha/beta fold hydrolase BchO [Fertoeibacter niger]NUB43513.1 alpha/beta fold hydrolase [Fertoeibacter niger]
MDFARIPPDWPGRANMRRISARPHQWCVLEQGAGPVVLLLHGAGGASHSFRALLPLLAPHYRLIAPDLPGQGFTRAGARQRLGLDAMAEDLARLCAEQGWPVAAIIGHSAGAAVALRMAEIMAAPPRAVVGINAALGAFEGVAGFLFPLLAKVMALNPLVPRLFARLWGNEARVQSLLASTGSTLDAAGVAHYLALVRDPDHVEGTLGMMAQWKLDGLMARLPQLALPVLLIAGARDRAVPPQVSRDAVARMPGARYAELPGLGHLMHEEAADQTAALILPFLAAHTRADQRP